MIRKLPERSATSGLRNTLFLLQQPWIWGPAVLGGLLSGAGLVLAGTGAGKPLAELLPLALFLTPVMGLAFVTVTSLPAFLLSRWLRAQPYPAPDDAELNRPANHFLNGEARGGSLYLCPTHLRFRPHRFNFQLEGLDIPREAITGVGWGNVTGPKGMQLSSILEVDSGDGSHRFVVQGARDLAERLAEREASSCPA